MTALVAMPNGKLEAASQYPHGRMSVIKSTIDLRAIVVCGEFGSDGVEQDVYASLPAHRRHVRRRLA